MGFRHCSRCRYPDFRTLDRFWRQIARNRRPSQQFLYGKEQGCTMSNAKPIRAVNVVELPPHRVAYPLREGATIFDIARSRVRAGAGRLLNWLGVPAAIKP